MCRSQPMNLRSCVLLNGWRCCTTITIGYAKQSARSPVAQTFMIWSFDWGSAWSRSPFASTELSTLVFRAHVLWRSRKSILFRPKGTDVRRLEGEIQTIDTREWSICASAGHSITFVGPPFPHCPDRNSGGDMPLGPSAPGNCDRKLVTKVRNKMAPSFWMQMTIAWGG